MVARADERGREVRTRVLGSLIGLCGALAAATPAAALTPTVSEFSEGLSSGGPTAITSGPEGNLWFVQSEDPGRIGKITPSGVITEVASGGSTPGLAMNSHPAGIAVGPDGALYFTEQSNPGAIAKVEPASGGVVEVASGGHGLAMNRGPDAITIGPEGNLWFTELQRPGAIARLTLAGAVSEFSAGLSPTSEPSAVTLGPEGNLWFTELVSGAAEIGTINPTNGAVGQFFEGLTPAGGLFGITPGIDGNLWFTESADPGRVGKVTPTGSISEVALGGATPGFSANSGPRGIVTGPEGYLWFTEGSEPAGPGRIARMNPATGSVEEFPLPSAGTGPNAIVVGSDGNIWFTETAGDRIGRITTPPSATTTAAGALSTSAATVTGLVNGNSQPTTYHIEYGPLGGPNASTPEQALGVTAASTPVAAVLTELLPETAYQVRVVATNPTGSTPSQVATFITSRAPLSVPLVLSGVHESAKKWREGTRLPRISARKAPAKRPLPVGTTISFLLNGKASVRFEFTQPGTGRLVGHRCLATTRKVAKRKTCKLTLTRGALSFGGHIGTNRVAFQGRVSRAQTLKPGSYTLVMSASNSSRQRSNRATLGFTIVK